MAKTKIEIFFSYAHADEAWRNQLDKHLGSLKRQNRIVAWHDGNIPPGAGWASEINAHLKTAHIILLLISPDFIDSKYCWSIELRKAIQRHNAGEACVIPIIVRPVDWKETPFAKLQALPTDGKPISTWPNIDEALINVVEGIEKAVEAQSEKIHQIQQPSFRNAVGVQEAKSDQIQQPPQNSTASHTTQSPISTNDDQLSQTLEPISKEATPDAMKATTDKAVRRLSEDKLGFTVWVTALRNFIVSPDTSTPLTIGIDGPWGSGKSSFMYMLKDLLEPSFSFWASIWEIKWPWFIWLVKCVVTLPIWVIGKLLVLAGKNTSGKRQAWFQNISDSLSYDPEIDSIVNLRRLPRHQRFWAKIAALHCPRRPIINPTIWFNAWKFDQEEQLWAALALEVLHQIKRKYNFFQRIFFWFRLMLKRFSLDALWSVIKTIALPIFFGLVYWIYTSYMKQLPHVPPLQVSGFQIPLGQLLLGAGIVVSALIQILKIAKDPFQLDFVQFG